MELRDLQQMKYEGPFLRLSTSLRPARPQQVGRCVSRSGLLRRVARFFPGPRVSERRSFVSKFATTDVRGNKTVEITAPVEKASINSDVGRATSFGAFAILLADRTSTVVGSFFWGEKFSLWHICVSLPPVAACDANLL